MSLEFIDGSSGWLKTVSGDSGIRERLVTSRFLYFMTEGGVFEYVLAGICLRASYNTIQWAWINGYAGVT